MSLSPAIERPFPPALRERRPPFFALHKAKGPEGRGPIAISDVTFRRVVQAQMLIPFLIVLRRAVPSLSGVSPNPFQSAATKIPYGAIFSLNILINQPLFS